MRAELESIAQRSFKNNIATSEHAIASCESGKSSNESAIEQLNQTMKATSGSGMGCAFFGLFWIVAQFSMMAVAYLVTGDTNPERHPYYALIAFGTLGAAIVGAVIGRSISRHRKNDLTWSKSKNILAPSMAMSGRYPD